MSLKVVVFIKIWSFNFFLFFSDFNDFISYFKSHKRGLFSTGPAEDMWRAELTCHTGPARPRNRAVQAHATSRWRGREARATRVHADARGGRHVVRGGWYLKGPRDSGPSLRVSGGNANALSRHTFYTYLFPFFLPCGTKFLEKFVFAGDVATPWASDAIEMTEMFQSRGPKSMRSPSKHVCVRCFK